MAPEIQAHGFTFEKWVRDTFFDVHTTSYTEEWDVSAQANTRYGRVPVSIKVAKYGSAIGLGDALRQFKISEDFLLIAGFWKQEGANKRFVNVVAAPVMLETWRVVAPNYR